MRRNFPTFLAIISLLVGIGLTSQSQAVIINPAPGSYGADNGAQTFSASSSVWSIEVVDLFGVLSLPSSFGFFFVNADLTNPASYIPIFKPADQGSIQAAAIFFDLGVVFDLDAQAVESIFTPGNTDIGFYYSFLSPTTGAPVVLTTIPTLNPGGADWAAAFPSPSQAGHYLLGFGDVIGDGPTLAYYAIGTPVPEPGTLLLLSAGLFVGGLAHIITKRKQPDFFR